MPIATRLIEVLRATLLEVEQSAGVSADDPALVALKQIFMRRIADLELEALEPITEATPPESGPPSATTDMPGSPTAGEAAGLSKDN